MRTALTCALTLSMLAAHQVAFAQDAPVAQAAAERLDDGLVALYRFDEVIEGLVIPDATAAVGGLDLLISGSRLALVEVRDGALHFAEPAQAGIPGVFSTEPATPIVSAVRASGQLTVEAWVSPANTRQAGPARIVTISRDASSRNVTLGQEGDRYILRLRTSATGEQGTPAVETPAETVVAEALQHVVATFDGQTTAIYLDGEPVVQSIDQAGTVAAWDETMFLVLGNEFDGDRRWYGSIRLVAFYAHALSPTQVRANFEAGL